MKKVFLITKLKTTNIGNDALSNEIINLFSGISKEIILNVNGRPPGLDGYYPSRIIRKSNPVSILEKWADNIISKINKEKNQSFKSNLPELRLLNNDSAELKNERLKARLRPLKRLLISFIPYSKEYRQRAITLKSADWLIYSGAGEVGDNIVFLRQLVEIRVAQKLGIKTAAINQSVVIKTEPFKKLVEFIYGKMSKIVIRGETTRNNLVAYGVPPAIIEVAPDSSINCIFPNAGKILKNKNLIGINITPRTKISEEEISLVIRHLHSLGKTIIFVTNEPFDDAIIAQRLSEKFNIKFENNFTSYYKYLSRLAECDFVISARLHTNILSLVTHTPIIPIEGNVFKSTELLTQLQYPLPTLDSANQGWVKDLITEINNVANHRYDFTSYFKDIFPVHKKAVQKNASWLYKYL